MVPIFPVNLFMVPQYSNIPSPNATTTYTGLQGPETQHRGIIHPVTSSPGSSSLDIRSHQVALEPVTFQLASQLVSKVESSEADKKKLQIIIKSLESQLSKASMDENSPPTNDDRGDALRDLTNVNNIKGDNNSTSQSSGVFDGDNLIMFPQSPTQKSPLKPSLKGRPRSNSASACVTPITVKDSSFQTLPPGPFLFDPRELDFIGDDETTFLYFPSSCLQSLVEPDCDNRRKFFEYQESSGATISIVDAKSVSQLPSVQDGVKVAVVSGSQLERDVATLLLTDYRVAFLAGQASMLNSPVTLSSSKPLSKSPVKNRTPFSTPTKCGTNSAKVENRRAWR